MRSSFLCLHKKVGREIYKGEFTIYSLGSHSAIKWQHCTARASTINSSLFFLLFPCPAYSSSLYYWFFLCFPSFPIFVFLCYPKSFLYSLLKFGKEKKVCPVSSFCSLFCSVIAKMSSSSVCQGLQSCLTKPPRVLCLKLATPLEFPFLSQSETHPLTSPHTTCEKDLKQNKNPNADRGGWTFLQSLCNKTDKSETEKIYIHPLVKRSSSSMSAKSLEMCTESLGCENGSNGGESSNDIALFSLERNKSSLANPESDKNCVSKRSNRSVGNFPPPLSSMIKNGGILVRRRREDGRLILEAVPAPSHPSCFKANRSNGRLRLQLLSTFNHSLSGDHEPVEAEEEEKEEEDDDDGEVEEYWDENNENEEDEAGMRKIPRPSRCNEKGNMSNQMHDWEPFLVTI